MAKIGKDVDYAARLLSEGEIVGIPTETVYGLAANAFDEDAILKIYSAKQRPKFDPLIAHSDSIEKIKSWVLELPPKATILAEKFWPGPLTILLKKGPQVPDLLTSGLSRMAVRIPNHDLTLELLSKLDFPLAAPSANPFGFVSPTKAAHVEEQLGDKLEYILNGGTCKIGIESTIVGFENDEATIYRMGGLSQEVIEEAIGPVEVELNKSSNPIAPGMLRSHYSPGIPLEIGPIRELLAKFEGKRIGVISFSEFFHDATVMEVLSPRGDIEQAAKNLFQSLRNLGTLNLDLILAEKFPNKGIGRAINDRLERAAAK